MRHDTIGKAILVFLLLLSMKHVCFAQGTIMAIKYGITDLKSVTQSAQLISNGVDSLEYTEESGSKNGSLGMDFLIPVDDDKRLLYIDMGLYYNSSTLIGNPKFRYDFIYAQQGVNADTTIQTKYSYGNFKIGLAVNLTRKLKTVAIMPALGLDLEYGEVVQLNSDFAVDVNGSAVRVSGLFVQNRLIYGPYLRLSIYAGLKNGLGLVATPGYKYTFSAEDDFENDRTITYPPRGSFDFTIGIAKQF